MHKIYVMAAPCSGKSTFALNGTYRDVRLVDFNVHFEHWARASDFDLVAFSRTDLEARESVYNAVNIEYLSGQTDSVCLLGVVGPDDPWRYRGLSCVIVQPPIARAAMYCARRKWTLLNQRQTSPWSKWRNILAYRRKLAAYAHAYDIPVYPSFEAALDAVLGP